MLDRVFIMFAFTVPLSESLSVHKGTQCTIKICQNKDCTKRGGGERLYQTFRDLVPPSDDASVPVIERSGCL